MLRTFIFYSFFITALVGCGGGGGDTPVTNNTAPTDPAATSMNWNDSNWDTLEWKKETL